MERKKKPTQLLSPSHSLKTLAIERVPPSPRLVRGRIFSGAGDTGEECETQG